VKEYPKTSKLDLVLILKIVERAHGIVVAHGGEYDKTSAGLDLVYAHAQVPLDLEALLAADDFNFMHDVFGIARHMDRSTGEMDGRFLPRFALRSREDVATPA